jgi:hypothetical protein
MATTLFMKRRWFLVLGVGIILANLGFLFAFRAGIFETPSIVAANVFLILGGALMIIGGADVQPRGSEWYQFVGAANVLIAAGMAGTYLLPMVNGTSAYEGTAGALFVVFVVVVGGGSLAFIGLDWIRGGRHFDLSTYERGSILGPATEHEK